MFSYASLPERPTKLADVSDGTSNTVLYAEVKRGASPGRNAVDVTLIPVPLWGTAAR